MSDIQNALVWGAAIIVFALLAVSGPIESDVAQTMLIILPVLAWSTLGAKRSCLPCPLARTGEKS
ncbi:hypothetical protein [Aurantiacibacter sp. D1-12]|uniref:hypothetical protein n=1 Tax=Aurantiacibacter sp. D1-12 TaxID=2993658 RepID=UPI00237D1E3E|nr:hypothetical protein [Aurantiacibacter sp. D1-12]MDE1467266.1 hypothetical protein [Aurantiacibacter sp. D1-12]